MTGFFTFVDIFGHVQVAIYTVFDEEPESEVKNANFGSQEGKIEGQEGNQEKLLYYYFFLFF